MTIHAPTIRRYGLTALLVLAPVLIYGQMWNHALLDWDDPPHITKNPHLVPLRWSGLIELWQAPYFGVYVPVFYTWVALEKWIAEHVGSGAAPHSGVYHLGSLALHVANVLLVFAILRRLIGNELAAALGALLFAVHPLQVESVAWVSETRGLLAALFGLISIWFYLGWAECGAVRTGRRGQAAESGGKGRLESQIGHSLSASEQANAMTTINRMSRPPWQCYALALAAYLFALLSKPSAVAVPLVLVVISLGRPRPNGWRMLIGLLPWFVLAAALTLITKGEQGEELIDFVVPLADRPRLAGDALTFYLLKLVCPWNLATDYGRSARWLIAQEWTWWTAVVPLVLGGVLLWKRQWMLLQGGAIFTAALLPVLGFVPFAFQNFSTVADRYAYLALLGPALAVAWWAAQKPSPGRLSLISAILLLLAIDSFAQVGNWRDDRHLFTHTLKVNPRSYLAEDKVGMDLYRRGAAEKAIDHFRAAERLKPDFAAAFNNAGTVLLELKQWNEAAEQLTEAARLKPADALIRYNLATAFSNEKKHREAERCFAEAVKLAPDLIPARLAYGFELSRRGESKQALAQMDAILKIDPYHVRALCAKGQVLSNQGSLAAAEAYLAAAVRLAPDDSEAREALARVKARRQSGE